MFNISADIVEHYGFVFTWAMCNPFSVQLKTYLLGCNMAARERPLEEAVTAAAV